MKGGSSHGETGGRTEVVRQARTVKVNQAEAMAFLDKADRYKESAQDNLDNGNWDGAADDAVQCVVSAIDALLGLKHGLRPSGINYLDSATLLAEKEGTKEARINAVSLIKMVNKKNLVQSEGRSVSKTEAGVLMMEAILSLEWAKDQFNR